MDLKSLREKKEVTQQEVAIKVGVSRQMISAIEKGQMPSVDTAKKIARELGFDWTKFYES